MTLERFAAGDSWVHRLDPRIKIATALAFSIVVALCDRFPSLLAALAFPAVVVVCAKLPLKAAFGQLLLVDTFLVFVWVFIPFTMPGRAVFVVGPFDASAEGIRFAAVATLRANAIVIGTIAFLATSNMFALAHALAHFRVPEKLIHLIFFSYRYIFVIENEYLRLRLAMRARAFRPRADAHTYRSFGYLLGMLLARSHQRAHRIYDAMRCRGFDGQFAPLEHFHLRRADALAGLGAAVLIVAIAALEWGPALA